MSGYLQMDWLDGILIAATFCLGIILASSFPESNLMGSNISVMGVLAAPVLRRVVLGAPNLPEPRAGVFWGLVSITGLLLLFFSVGVFFMASIAIQQSSEPMPDFRAEVESRQAEYSESTREIDAFLNAVVVPAGTPQEEIDRLTEEKKKEREAEKKASVDNRVQELETEFVQRKKERFEEGVYVLMIGFLVSLLGSACLWLRYPSQKEEIPVEFQ